MGLACLKPIDYELLTRARRNRGGTSGASTEEMKELRAQAQSAAKANERLSKELADLRESLKAVKEKIGKGPNKEDPKCVRSRE